MSSFPDEKNSTSDLAVLILAAGSSSRLGQSKQLLSWKGVTLLEHAVRVAKGSGIENITVVLGANLEAHLEKISSCSVSIVHNPHWKLGMGSSLKAGLRTLQLEKAKGVIIMVCDQPMLDSAHLKKMIAHFDHSKKQIIASAYHQTTGVPVLFHQHWFDQLLSLSDTEGAKKIILQHPDFVIPVSFPGGEIDIDTMEDLPHLQE